MGIAGLGRQDELHGVVRFVLQAHAEGVIAHRAVAGDALAASDQATTLSQGTISTRWVVSSM
jgi:hypothetical protein